MPELATRRISQPLAAPELADQYRRIRSTTLGLAEPLSAEDCTVQSMPEVSPTKWHLAHTTWFFETFVLPRFGERGRFHPQFEYLFNSYYESVGPQYPRARHGLLTRPGLAEVLEYRHHVDGRLAECLEQADSITAETSFVIELGLHHEQQHQELLLTDIKHVLSCNPLSPAYRQDPGHEERPAPDLRWIRVPDGVREIGSNRPHFAFDNERPRHRVVIHRCEVASRLVTNREYFEFIEDGGYRRPELWLSEGWEWVRNAERTAPLYWRREEGGEREFTLYGLVDRDPDGPVSHVAFFEADAYARWAGVRLPTEAEWETLAADQPITGNFLDDGCCHPRPVQETTDAIPQLFGDLWEWTSSPYVAYPGYRPFPGGLGEYNGKFMCNQMVLRGGSCVTARDHIRPTYRNFFPTDAQWQFTGIRLARDVED